MHNKLLIKNGIIITLGENNQVLYDHDLLIEKEVITKIAKSGSITGPFTKEIDAKGKVILPGFINTHMHFYSTLVRGLGKAKPSQNFQEVLENLWWRLDKKLTLEDTYMSTLIVLLNAIRHGTTTFIDHHASPRHIKGSLNEIARAIKETGLRGCLCYEVSDRDGKKTTQEGLKENAEFIKYCRELPDDQLKALFGLHASFTVSEKTLEQASQMAHDLNVGFHVHTAEAESDQTETLKMCGQRVVERFKTHDILGPQTICAHCVHVDNNEIDLLAQTDTIVVHNPQSNMNNAVGIADIIKMSGKGILVGLGTDAMTVNMTEEARVAMWAQHLRAGNPTCGFMEVCDTLFTNNAKIAGRIWNDVKIGAIEKGYAADLAIIDYIPPTPLESATALGHLIFGISQSTVDTTITKGKVLMENKILKLDIDEERISAHARKLTKKLWKRF
jgi:putative selenium metabolism protein SsnA